MSEVPAKGMRAAPLLLAALACIGIGVIGLSTNHTTRYIGEVVPPVLNPRPTTSIPPNTEPPAAGGSHTTNSSSREFSAYVCNKKYHVTNIRSGPSAQRHGIAFTLNNYDTVTVLGLESSPVNGATWYKIRAPSVLNNEGYMDAEFVSENCPSGAAPTSAPQPIEARRQRQQTQAKASSEEDRRQAENGAVRVRFAKDGERAVLVRIVKDEAGAVRVRTAKNGEDAVTIRVASEGEGAVTVWFVPNP